MRVPITFRIPPETPSAPEVSTDAMTAARRVVAALGGQEAFVKQMENLAAAILDQPVTGGDLNAEERRRLYEAVQAVTRQYREESVEALAHTYAQNLSLSDLQAYAAFLESPAGQRLAASQMGLEPVRSELEGFRQRVIQSLRERVCGPVRPCRPTRSELGGH